ncbi:MAG TPA: DUF4836 family protein [Flavisolibacter sp.]
MKRIPLLTSVALVATLFFVSCKSGGGTSDLPIPKDAAFVFHVNTSSLTSKLSWDEIKQSGWFKENYEKEKDSFTRKIMENPENSGVDMKSDFVVFMKKQGKSGYVVVEGKIKSTSDFEALINKNKEGKTIQKDGDLNYVSTENDESLVSWNKSTFIIMANAPFMGQMNMMGEEGNYEGPYSFPVDSLKKFTKDLLALKESNSLTDDDRFEDLLEEKGDMHFWMNSEAYMSSMGGVMSMFKFGDLMKGNIGTFTLNFDDGQINVKSKSYYGKELAKLMENYKPRNVDEALINRIPSQDVVGAMVLNFDPVWLKQFLKAAGLDGFANSYLGRMDLNLDEVIGAMGGQFMMSFSDFSITKKEVTYPPFYDGGEPYTMMKEEPEFNMLVVSSVGNKASFDKLMNIAKQNMMGMDTAVSYKVNNEWFAVSNKPETVDKFMAGGNNKVPFADKISGHPFGMYIDLQKIFKATQSANAMDSTTFDLASKTWLDIVGTGGEYKDGVMSGEFVINMVDKKTNSLKQLNQFAEKMNAAEKAKRNRFPDDVVIESYPSDSSSYDVQPAPALEQ